jgi:hypothetical protein
MLERMTRRASLLYAAMAAGQEWETLSWKKRKERFGAMLESVLREYKVSEDEWALYKSVLGSWLSKRSLRKRARVRAEYAYYAAHEENPVQDSDQRATADTLGLFPDFSSYPCVDYQSS